MSRERLLRGDREGRERQRDWSTLADEYGITPDEAAALHDVASRNGEVEAAARPAPGKVARTMRLSGELTFAGWRTGGPGATATGPAAATLLDHAQLYLGSARRDALAVLEAAAGRADDVAARRAWSSACSYLGLVEQCLVDAERRAPTGAEAAAIARQVAEARAACAELSARGARIVDRLQRPRPADTERERPAVPAARGPGGEVPYRAEMEAAFGRSFRGVIAHTGAEEACDGLEARAYAVGETIVFASASPDRETVAHELTHVLQHRAARGSSRGGQSGVSRPGDASEREADRVAAQVAAGHAVRGPVAATASAAIHRRPGAPREVFEFSLERAINRVSLSLRFKVSRKDPAAATGEVTAGEDTKLTGAAVETKLSLKRAAGKWSWQLAGALLRMGASDDDIHVPGFPSLKVKADLKVLEGKVANLRGKDFDLDVLKVGLALEWSGEARELDPDLANTAMDLNVKIAGRADVPLTAEDLARITQAVRASRAVTRSDKLTAKAEKRLARLDKQHAELDKLRRGRSGAARKKLSKKLAKLSDAKKEVRRRIAGLRRLGVQATESLHHASSGLKGGAGKLVNKALVKATAKALARFGGLLVPGLNVLSLVMTAWDLVELFRAMADGDDEEAGAGGGQGATGDGDVAGGAASADAGVEGGADVDAGDESGAGEDEAGGVVAGVNEGDAGDLDGGEDDAGDLDGGEDDAGGGETVELHPGAESVLELIEGSGGEPLDGAGREMLNDLVPRDLSDRELDALRERLAARPRGGSDVFATVGAVREEIERIREGEPTSRLVIDGKEFVDTPGGGVEEAKQAAKTGEATGGKRGEEKPAIDDSHLFRPDIGDARQGVRWDAESGTLSIDEKWAAWVTKELRPRSAEGGVGRATSIAIASQRDVGAAGQPLIEYTIAIAVEIDVKGHIENHTEKYTLFYDPATGGHSREEAAGDLVAAFHSVLEFGEDGAVAIKGGGVYRGETIDFLVRGVEPDASGSAKVRVQFTRTPRSWKVRTVAGWLTPSPDRVVEVHIPSPTRPSP